MPNCLADDERNKELEERVDELERQEISGGPNGPGWFRYRQGQAYYAPGHWQYAGSHTSPGSSGVVYAVPWEFSYTVVVDQFTLSIRDGQPNGSTTAYLGVYDDAGGYPGNQLLLLTYLPATSGTKNQEYTFEPQVYWLLYTNINSGVGQDWQNVRHQHGSGSAYTHSNHMSTTSLSTKGFQYFYKTGETGLANPAPSGMIADGGASGGQQITPGVPKLRIKVL